MAADQLASDQTGRVTTADRLEALVSDLNNTLRRSGAAPPAPGDAPPGRAPAGTGQDHVPKAPRPATAPPPVHPQHQPDPADRPFDEVKT